MGGGASISSENSAYPSTPGYLSANGARLRRAIVMRAYNLQRRKPKMGAITFEEQFASFAYIKVRRAPHRLVATIFELRVPMMYL
jgi:hypothetical protein